MLGRCTCLVIWYYLSENSSVSFSSVQPKFIGSYEVVKVVKAQENERYDVKRIWQAEGLILISTCVNCTKPYFTGMFFDGDDSNDEDVEFEVEFSDNASWIYGFEDKHDVKVIRAEWPVIMAVWRVGWWHLVNNDCYFYFFIFYILIFT